MKVKFGKKIRLLRPFLWIFFHSFSKLFSDFSYISKIWAKLLLQMESRVALDAAWFLVPLRPRTYELVECYWSCECAFSQPLCQINWMARWVITYISPLFKTQSSNRMWIKMRVCIAYHIYQGLTIKDCYWRPQKAISAFEWAWKGHSSGLLETLLVVLRLKSSH